MNEMRCYVTITGGNGKKGSRELYDLPVELEGQRDVLEAFVRTLPRKYFVTLHEETVTFTLKELF